MWSEKNSLCKQIALNKAIYFLLSFNPVNLGTLLSITRFFRKPSKLVLLYSVIFWPESSTFTLPSFAKNRVATTNGGSFFPVYRKRSSPVRTSYVIVMYF